MKLTDLREGFEELNLPVEKSLDDNVYREAYRDLIKSRTCKYLTYDSFLKRMKMRNINSRKKEFERRRSEVNFSFKDVEWVSA